MLIINVDMNDGHRGYQKWHRQLDYRIDEAVYLSKNLADFEKRLNGIYSDYSEIFGEVIIKLLER